MDNGSEFNSKWWWPHIASLARSFVDFVNYQNQTTGSDNAIILKVKDIEQIEGVYYKNLKSFKRKFYGKKEADEHKLDVHKVAALYIKTFLDESPFYIINHKPGNKSNFTKVQLYPNEYFAMELMELILVAWKKSESSLRMEDNEEKWFIGLLNHFRLDSSKLDVLSLASIIYYIEDKYFPKK